MKNSKKKRNNSSAISMPKTLEEFAELTRQKDSSPTKEEKEGMITYEVKFVSNRRNKNN